MSSSGNSPVSLRHLREYSSSLSLGSSTSLGRSRNDSATSIEAESSEIDVPVGNIIGVANGTNLPYKSCSIKCELRLVPDGGRPVVQVLTALIGSSGDPHSFVTGEEALIVNEVSTTQTQGKQEIIDSIANSAFKLVRLDFEGDSRCPEVDITLTDESEDSTGDIIVPLENIRGRAEGISLPYVKCVVKCYFLFSDKIEASLCVKATLENEEGEKHTYTTADQRAIHYQQGKLSKNKEVPRVSDLDPEKRSDLFQKIKKGQRLSAGVNFAINSKAPTIAIFFD